MTRAGSVEGIKKGTIGEAEDGGWHKVLVFGVGAVKTACMNRRPEI